MEALPPMTSPSPAKRFNWTNLRVRVLSATVLVPTVVAAVWFGGVWYLGLISVCVALLAREWGMMSAPKAPIGVGVAVGVASLVALVAAFRGHYYLTGPLLVVGAILAALLARGAVERRADAAYGVIYIAPACIALIWLRLLEAGLSWTLLLFVVTWFADIFAFVTGSFLMGP
jgi:phosphatidate cytidylyltransferase